MSHRLLHLLCVSQNASQVYLTLLKLYGTDEQEEPVPVRPADCVEWHVRYKKKKKETHDSPLSAPMQPLTLYVSKWGLSCAEQSMPKHQ